MIYGINHTTHSTHTIKPGSNLETQIIEKLEKTKKVSCVVKIGHHKMSVSADANHIKGLEALLMLDGSQQ